MVLSHNLVHKVTNTIKKHSMLSGEEKILVGLSGGPDSVCLLHMLNKIKDDFRLSLYALYIDHWLRTDETGSEIEFCKNLCESLDIPFIIKSINVKSCVQELKINIQEAARQLRYKVFEETAYETNAHKIALGHTADDQAETVLMRLFRGSGTTGLSGIPPVRAGIIRPLIEIERTKIEQFLDEGKIDFIVDSSNLKKDYLRNKIRLSLIPMLKEFNPDIIETLSKTAELFRDEERFFTILVTKTMMKLISRKTDTRIELFLAPLEIMDKVIMRRVLRRAIDETTGLRGINFVHIEDIIEIIKNGKHGDRLYLPKGIREIKGYSNFTFTSEPPVRLNTYTFEVPGEVILKEGKVVIKAFLGNDVDDYGDGKPMAVFDGEKTGTVLIIRPRENGDFFYPMGFGRRKKLQDYFVDEKVPRDERDSVPVVASGNDIVWIAGFRCDERFKVTKETKKVVKLEVKKIMD